MKKILLLVCFILSLEGFAQQFKTAEVGVDGLTCSMCTRSTELSIRKLDFVDSVKMDLTNTNGIIYFKKGSEVKLEKIAKAVRDAGFSVRYLKAVFTFDSQNVNSGTCFSYGNAQYKFVGKENKTLSGEIKLTLVGKDFMPAKEYKKWSESVKDACTADKKTYYVTI